MSLLPPTLAARAKRLRIAVMIRCFPIYHAHRYYHSRTGKRLRYRNVQDLNEKLFWLERYWKNPLVVRCTDKVLVREYVASCGLVDLLNEVYAVYDTPDGEETGAAPQVPALALGAGLPTRFRPGRYRLSSSARRRCPVAG